MNEFRMSLLRERADAIRPDLAKAREITQKAEAERRDLTDDEKAIVEPTLKTARDIADGMKRVRDEDATMSAIRSEFGDVMGPMPGSPTGSKSRRLSFKGMGAHVAARMSPDGTKALAPSGAAVVGKEMKPDPVSLGQPALSLLDVIPVTAHAQPEFAYMRQTVRTNLAAVVAEGLTKPTSMLSVTRIEQSLAVVRTSRLASRGIGCSTPAPWRRRARSLGLWANWPTRVLRGGPAGYVRCAWAVSAQQCCTLCVVDDLEPLTDAERKLLEAVQTSAPCDLSQGDDAHRRVRAAVLKAILSGEGEAWGIGAGAVINLRGAVVSGVLGEFDGSRLPPIRLESCRFEDSVDFSGATFTGDASFEKATFTGDASFREATFTGDVRFRKATFTGAAVFDEATFTRAASFINATFTRTAWFIKATFTGAARFGGATFTGDALFMKAIFTGAALFVEAIFTGAAVFDGALAHRLSFSRARFSAPDPGPWIASTISLDRTALAVRSHISITAKEVDAAGLQAAEGVDLILHCETVALNNAEFLRASNVFTRPNLNHARYEPTTEPTDTKEDEARRAQTVSMENMIGGLPTRCSVTSLEGANVAALSLREVDLKECAFAWASGLDALRIGTGCSFQSSPPRWGRVPITRRQIIADEVTWRRTHTGRRRIAAEPFVPALELARIYRELRKGREDAKNEPGANDFYYGEMEMRRLAGRKPTDAASNPSWAERLLLYGYWAVSGYGLRASRALLTLVAVLAGAAFLYTMPAFATVTSPPERIVMIDPSSGAVTYSPPTEVTAPRFSTALEYSARESISLLQARGMPAVDTTGVGTLLGFLLRLAGPVLLAFAVLALRGRTKR